jgi:hypothetical protein
MVDVVSGTTLWKARIASCDARDLAALSHRFEMPDLLRRKMPAGGKPLQNVVSFQTTTDGWGTECATGRPANGGTGNVNSRLDGEGPGDKSDQSLRVGLESESTEPN